MSKRSCFNRLCFHEKTSGSDIKNEKISNNELAKKNYINQQLEN